jgi:hypothetical protein
MEESDGGWVAKEKNRRGSNFLSRSKDEHFDAALDRRDDEV